MNTAVFSQLDSFLESQLKHWPQARKAFDDLKDVMVRKVPGTDIVLQYNPARISSTTARTKPGEIAARPCFLCAGNRPAQQTAVDLGNGFELTVNPYPILRNHLCVISRSHRPQRFADCCQATLDIAAALPEDHIILYNGPHSGASAPDHLHMQIGLADGIPLVEWLKGHFSEIPQSPATVRPLGFPVTVLSDPDCRSMTDCLDAMPKAPDEYEPRFNLLAMNHQGRVICAVIPRTFHRPSCYYSTDSRQRLVSPGAIDMFGLLITPRKQDFDSLDAAQVERIYSQVTPSRPRIRVGIMSGTDIRFTLNGTFRFNGTPVTGEHGVSLQDGRLAWMGGFHDSITLIPDCSESTFTLEDVTIGSNFHWQRRERQTFPGALQFIADSGTIHAINAVDIEDYLTSVISSEMKATAAPEFLKAHAVISRSWVMAQLRPGPEEGEAGQTAAQDRIIRWYDHDQHRLFDVCADDHCQRYQGLTRVISEAARKAVSDTCGQVLLYKGRLCDARFSKCCGGMTEQFETCWQDRHVPYLVPVSDPFCGQADADTLRSSLNGYDLETPDWYRWTRHYSAEELSELIARKTGIGFGTVIGLKPLKRGPSGRIFELEVQGTERSVIFGKELEIRRILSDTHLLSSAFEVECEHDANGNVVAFTLHGSGWGHGVGLCQIGAARMGSLGYTYREILEHYYPGTETGKAY